ncbi:MAG: N-acetyl-gamma-glutamyl-phosphate reductase [Candidatus Hydrogenedentes bacterium]|nr:N-acetyl-gamma-glutamyl-phosphate reductase [Candidatus Hydrogenedentota bacterium]
MIKVGIVGATGYGGRELLRLLLAHPGVEIVALASTSAGGQRVDAVLPAFRKLIDLKFEAFDPGALAKQCEAVFVGVPGKESMKPVAQLRAAGARVLDIGPDFRLKDTRAFSAYYQVEHTSAEHLPGAVYGLPPWYRNALRDAQLVAVPGCYPISVILPLRPLLDAPLSEIPAVADSISGISGAGRGLKEDFHFPEMNENLKAYKVGAHQHIPEIEQELQHRMQVQFTPHVAPLTRGILSTITVRMREDFDPAPYYACYENEPFVRVLGENQLAEVKHVRGSNFCDFGWVIDKRTKNLVIVSAIDNLMGGTAGMAVQCLNIMFGLEEGAGLDWGGMAP